MITFLSFFSLFCYFTFFFFLSIYSLFYSFSIFLTVFQFIYFSFFPFLIFFFIFFPFFFLFFLFYRFFFYFLGYLGVADVLCFILKTHSFSTSVVEWCSNSIATLCERNSENQLLFGNSSSYSPNMKNTEKDEKDGKEKEKEKEKDNHEKENKEKEVERKTRRNSISFDKPINISELLITAMNVHKNNIVVILQVTKAVRTLSKDQIEIQLKFSEENVVKISLKILKIHRGNEFICENIGWILTNFTVPKTVNNAVSVISTQGNNVENDGLDAFSLTSTTTSTPPRSMNNNDNNNNLNVTSYYENNKNLIYKNIDNWTLLVSCIEHHIIKGEKK